MVFIFATGFTSFGEIILNPTQTLIESLDTSADSEGMLFLLQKISSNFVLVHLFLKNIIHRPSIIFIFHSFEDYSLLGCKVLPVDAASVRSWLIDELFPSLLIHKNQPVLLVRLRIFSSFPLFTQIMQYDISCRSTLAWM